MKISLVWWEINSNYYISRVNQKKIISSRKEYIKWKCFKFWPMKNFFRKILVDESLILACLQIYQELLLLMTFLRVHSNSKEVSHLSWQNTYPNLKTTCHINLKFLLWNKLLENLFLIKYLISVAAPLKTSSHDHQDHPNQHENSHKVCGEMGHLMMNLMQSQWKLRQ